MSDTAQSILTPFCVESAILRCPCLSQTHLRCHVRHGGVNPDPFLTKEIVTLLCVPMNLYYKGYIIIYIP